METTALLSNSFVVSLTSLRQWQRTTRKHVKKDSKYLIHFSILGASMFISRGRSMCSCVCFHASVCSRTRPPSFPLRLSQVYPGGGCSVPELSHQSKHKCTSGGPEATWFSLCLLVSLYFNICLSMPHLFSSAFVPTNPSCIENDLEQKYGVCADFRNPDTAGLFWVCFRNKT